MGSQAKVMLLLGTAVLLLVTPLPQVNSRPSTNGQLIETVDGHFYIKFKNKSPLTADKPQSRSLFHRRNDGYSGSSLGHNRYGSTKFTYSKAAVEAEARKLLAAKKGEYRTQGEKTFHEEEVTGCVWGEWGPVLHCAKLSSGKCKQVRLREPKNNQHCDSYNLDVQPCSCEDVTGGQAENEESPAPKGNNPESTTENPKDDTETEEETEHGYQQGHKDNENDKEIEDDDGNVTEEPEDDTEIVTEEENEGEDDQNVENKATEEKYGGTKEPIDHDSNEIVDSDDGNVTEEPEANSETVTVEENEDEDDQNIENEATEEKYGVTKEPIDADRNEIVDSDDGNVTEEPETVIEEENEDEDDQNVENEATDAVTEESIDDENNEEVDDGYEATTAAFSFTGESVDDAKVVEEEENEDEENAENEDGYEPVTEESADDAEAELGSGDHGETYTTEAYHLDDKGPIGGGDDDEQDETDQDVDKHYFS